MLLPEQPIQAVVFDHDGTMFNTEELYQQVGTELLRRRGKPFTAELLNQMMGRPPKISLRIMIDYHGLSDTPEQLSQETDEIFGELLNRELATMPGLLELLSAIESLGLPKAIATSSGPRFVQRCLSPFGLRERFEFILTHEDVTHGKPHPEMYLTAAARWGYDPGRVLVLEDSQHGCRAAVDAGTYAVAVPGGHSRTHDFRGARFIADTLADRRIYRALGLE